MQGWWLLCAFVDVGWSQDVGSWYCLLRNYVTIIHGQQNIKLTKFCLILLQTDRVEGLTMAGAVSWLHLYAIMECNEATLHFYNVSFCNVIAYMCACVPAYICEDMLYVESITWHVLGADNEYTSKGINVDLHGMQWIGLSSKNFMKTHDERWLGRLLKRWNILVILCSEEHNLGHSTRRLNDK
jgi:hypothetical protein